MNTLRSAGGSESAALFDGPGELRARCRELDWASTPLGAPEHWPPSLRTVVAVLMASGFPMILVWGPELVQIYNDAYVPLIGRRHPAALGRPTHETWPEIRDLQEPIFRRVFRGETVNLSEAHYPLDRNGVLEDLYFDATFAPVPGVDGAVGGSLSTLFEVTARVRERILELERAQLLAESEAARARLGRLLAQTPAAVAVLHGPDHVVDSANPMFLRLIGRRDYLGRRAAEVVPELETQGFRRLMDEVYRDGVAYEGVEARLVWDRDGTGTLHEGFFNFVFQPITDADGAVEGLMLFAVDVTDQVRLREAAESARAEAEAANRAKGEFLAVMSHELRTPLNAIGGYAEILDMGLRGPVTEAMRADLAHIQQSQRHLLGLINEVLNYARIETGTLQYDLQEVPVRDALEAAESLVAPQAHSKRLTLRLAEGVPSLSVLADPDKLQQILVNILSNAVKFTEAGGSVEMSCGDAEGVVHIRVRDTGIGIPQDKLETIFDPFVQVRADLSRPHGGTGLGLAISRDLARGMAGDLTAESTPGVGSTFILTLPRP